MQEKPRFRVKQDGSVFPLNASALAMFGEGRKRDAARKDLSEFSGWAPRPGFGGSIKDSGWDTITGRARNLDENNGWINGGLDRRIESVIGVNIRLSAQPVHDLLKRDYAWRMAWTADVQARFKVWGGDIERRCDARQRLSFGAMAKLAYLHYVRDGEIAAEVRDNKRGLTNTTNVLLIEPERISTPDDKKHLEGPTLRDGIAMDANGAPIGYWISSAHPDDTSATPTRKRWDLVPARGKTGRAKLVHVFNPRRAEQNRGISRLAEVMVPAKMVDRVDRAEVEAALKSAILSFFIKSPGTTADLEGALAPTGGDVEGWLDHYLDLRTDKPVRIEGASITHLLPDEDVITPERNSPNANYPAFVKFVLQKIASSLGLSYPQLAQDYAGINYSSARALLNEIWRGFLEDRYYFTQAFLTPIYAAWLEIEVINGDVKIPRGNQITGIANFYRNKTAICWAEWIGPGRGSVDPLKESNSQNLDTAAGRASTVEHILERGRDPVDVVAEVKWWTEYWRDQGLPEPNYNVKAATDASNAEAAAEDADATEPSATPTPAPAPQRTPKPKPAPKPKKEPA